jgi:hypothetical protein
MCSTELLTNITVHTLRETSRDSIIILYVISVHVC